MKNYQAFAEAIRQAESSNRYDIKNRFGYLGAYQFGKARLLDLGISINDFGKYLHPVAYKKAKKMSEEEFLKNKELQDEVFREHCKQLARVIKKRFSYLLNKKHRNIKLTLSGMIAGAHLVGLGGLIKWINGKEVKDGNGVSVEVYLKKFQDYDLSEIEK